MVIDKYIHILKNTDEIINQNALDFKGILDEYPYFQSARALYLKALKKQESFKYNFELKKTAAYTTDRNILFDFITSKPVQKKVIQIKEISKKETPKTSETTAEVVITEKAKSIPQLKEELEIGKPLDFSANEGYSFNQWMQLASKKPIEREVKVVAKAEEPKSKKEEIIDKFIINNPKITPLDKNASNTFKPHQLTSKSNEIMTETLAKVYLEQNKYESAIKAYEILSLKYPEQSGFFADQIKRIRTIQKNK